MVLENLKALNRLQMGQECPILSTKVASMIYTTMAVDLQLLNTVVLHLHCNFPHTITYNAHLLS